MMSAVVTIKRISLYIMLALNCHASYTTINKTNSCIISLTITIAAATDAEAPVLNTINSVSHTAANNRTAIAASALSIPLSLITNSL